jgi:hypothetical protein
VHVALRTVKVLLPYNTADPHLKALKLPNQTPLEEPGGAGLGPVHAVRKVGSKAIECMPVEAHKPGGASLDANTTPAPTEGTASIKLAGRAVEATTAEPEALESWAESVAWRGLEMPPLSPPQEALTVGMHRPDQPPQESPSEGKCGLKQAPQETPQVGVPALQESVSAILKGMTPGFPKEDPPWGLEGEPGGIKSFNLKRPFEADKGDTKGHIGDMSLLSLAANSLQKKRETSSLKGQGS